MSGMTLTKLLREMKEDVTAMVFAPLFGIGSARKPITSVK